MAVKQVKFWRGTKAAFQNITYKNNRTLYFITNEPSIYKGNVLYAMGGQAANVPNDTTPKQVRFWRGSKSAYQSISTKDSGTLYFIKDEPSIYRGSVLYGTPGESTATDTQTETAQKPVKFWCGTKSAYQAITTKDVGTLYFITNEPSIYRGSVLYAKVEGSSGGDEPQPSDTTPPVAPSISANPISTTKTTGSVTLTAVFSEDSAQKLYRVGSSGQWQTYTSAITASANETYYFKALDEAGNESTASYAVKNIVPVAPTAVTPSTTATTSDPITLTATFGSGSTTKQYNVNGGSWLTYSGPVTVPSNGTYGFRSKKANGSYYSDATYYTVSNIVAPADTTPPVITLSGYNNTTSTTSTSITATTEAGVTIYWRKGSEGSWTVYSGAVAVTSNGTYNFQATDAAGNVGTNSVTFTNIQSGDENENGTIVDIGGDGDDDTPPPT